MENAIAIDNTGACWLPASVYPSRTTLNAVSDGSSRSVHLSTCHLASTTTTTTMLVVHNRTARRRQQRKFAPRVRSEDIVKAENGERTEDHLRRVTKWAKRAFQWCLQAASLRCLRRPKRAVFAVQGPPAYSCAPAQRPTYESAYQGSLRCVDTDDDDDAEMRVARQAAAEIEWHINETEPLTAGGIQKKSGLWSKDEHERYCQGLKTYRYGSWKLIADYVGTRTERQVLSHAQSIRAKRKRAEEREQGDQTGFTTSTSGQTGANKNARTTVPRCLSNSRPTRSVTAASMAGYDTNIGLGTPTPKFKPEDFQFGIGLAFRDEVEHLVADTTREAGVTPDELIPTHPAKECPAQFTLEDLDISADALLCSPSLDILLGNVVSDEDFFELLDIPSTLSEAQPRHDTCIPRGP